MRSLPAWWQSLLPGVLAFAVLSSSCYEKTGPVLGVADSPAALDPVPTPSQLAWERQELAAFLHFGIDTFTGKEIGDGTDSPTLFNPTSFDARQWITALRQGGFRQAMLTAKHHDGFCLWPTQCTTYSVAGSPYQGGRGDVVRQFVDAAREGNVGVGLALSPLDHHEPTYGTSAYAAVFECQLRELLTNYGAIDEIWLWQTPSAPNLDWKAIRELVHRLQPQALLELAGLPPTALNDVSNIGEALAGSPAPADQSSLQQPSDASGATLWIPAESVHSIRPSWFWHAAEDTRVMTGDALLSLYIDTVGRNSLLRLNVPPNTAGLLANPDVAALTQLGAAVGALYRTNVALGQSADADSVFEGASAFAAGSAVDGNPDTYWAAAEGESTGRLEVVFRSPRSFDLISVQEPIALGERTTQHQLEGHVNGAWTTLVSGTTIGERKLHRITAVTADRVALVITQARGAPAISELGIFDTTAP